MKSLPFPFVVEPAAISSAWELISTSRVVRSASLTLRVSPWQYGFCDGTARLGAQSPGDLIVVQRGQTISTRSEAIRFFFNGLLLPTLSPFSI